MSSSLYILSSNGKQKRKINKKEGRKEADKKKTEHFHRHNRFLTKLCPCIYIGH